MVVDTKNQVIEYINCGQPDPIIFDYHKDTFTALSEGSFPIGIFRKMPLKKGTYPYSDNVRIIMFTDGLFEIDNNDTIATYKKIKKYLRSMKDENEFHEHFTKGIMTNENRPDDISILSVTIKGKEAST